MQQYIKRILSIEIILVITLSIWFGGCANPSSGGGTAPKVYNLGDTGPAGGLIFYINPNYATDGWRYLEVWTANESGTYQWKTANTTTANTSTAIGTGYDNTYKYLTGTDHPAAEVCRKATHGGFDNWFLPSRDELEQMYVNLKKDRNVGGFDNESYWSSSDSNSIEAWDLYFGSGHTGESDRPFKQRVRAVRAF